MTLKRAGLILVTAGLVGAIIGIALSGDDFISARVWLGAASTTHVRNRSYRLLKGVDRAWPRNIVTQRVLTIDVIQHVTHVATPVSD